MLPDQRIGVKNGDGGAVSGENSADRYRGWAVDDRTVALRNRIYRVLPIPVLTAIVISALLGATGI